MNPYGNDNQGMYGNPNQPNPFNNAFNPNSANQRNHQNSQPTSTNIVGS